jgi:predicted PurR-regulated permease PerM
MHNNRQWIILGSIIALGLFLFYSLSPFLTALLGAIIIYNLAQPFISYLINVKQWKRRNAAILIMIISFFVILLPIFVLTTMLTEKVSVVINNPTQIQDSFNKAEEVVYNKFGVHLFTDDAAKKIQEIATSFVPGFINALANTILGLILMYFILYFMLIESGNIQNSISNYLPFTRRDDQLFVTELKNQTLSNAIGIPMLAIIQGSFSYVGYLVSGMPDAGFWAVISAFFSFIPMVGCALVWAPYSVYLLLTGDLFYGFGLILYGVIVVANVDNLFRFIMQKRLADVHPLVTVFGVIIGLKWFGFLGIIFGPLMISYFLILLKMYRKEYLEN